MLSQTPGRVWCFVAVTTATVRTIQPLHVVHDDCAELSVTPAPFYAPVAEPA